MRRTDASGFTNMLRRRQIAAILAVGHAAAAGAAGRTTAAPDTFVLDANDWMPNNPTLPVLHYRGLASDRPTSLEALFETNGWPPQWRNGVYRFHHYHSTAHEVLGFPSGRARLMLGGPGGREIDVASGDVLVLPTGTGHCLLAGSDDLSVIGAYPPGQRWDICRAAPAPDAVARMRHLPFPDRDPVEGDGGALTRLWRAA